MPGVQSFADRSLDMCITLWQKGGLGLRHGDLSANKSLKERGPVPATHPLRRQTPRRCNLAAIFDRHPTPARIVKR